MYLYGASGHAKVIIELFEKQQRIVSGLIDVNPAITKLFDYPVYSSFQESFFMDDTEVVISIGNNGIRKKIASELHVKYTTAVHPSANISTRIFVGEGTVVMAGVSINSEVTIGRHVILNTNCSIDHDCVIGDFVHVSPNAAIAGNVNVGEGTHVGIGACIIPGVKVGNWVTIGAGAVIINDVPDYAIVVGNPGKIIKYNKSVD
ncbi:acetyltransferase [Mucilaginibacter corticis]|uniref:Acetyltransferase n=1 Tax=Mucilaginibacter corticis TaxID=2597670 RepID=A0A556MXG7_9SPHI|nr:acetyltransferase [Mucilaginibacter corticis]